MAKLRSDMFKLTVARETNVMIEKKPLARQPSTKFRVKSFKWES